MLRIIAAILAALGIAFTLTGCTEDNPIVGDCIQDDIYSEVSDTSSQSVSSESESADLVGLPMDTIPPVFTDPLVASISDIENVDTSRCYTITFQFGNAFKFNLRVDEARLPADLFNIQIESLQLTDFVEIKDTLINSDLGYFDLDYSSFVEVDSGWEYADACIIFGSLDFEDLWWVQLTDIYQMNGYEATEACEMAEQRMLDTLGHSSGFYAGDGVWRDQYTKRDWKINRSIPISVDTSGPLVVIHQDFGVGGVYCYLREEISFGDNGEVSAIECEFRTLDWYNLEDAEEIISLMADEFTVDTFTVEYGSVGGSHVIKPRDGIVSVFIGDIAGLTYKEVAHLIESLI